MSFLGVLLIPAKSVSQMFNKNTVKKKKLNA